MNKAGIYHISEYTYAYAVGPETLRVRLKAGKDDVKSCKVYYKYVYDRSENHEEVSMQLVRCDGISDWYEADLYLPQKRFKYFFEIIDQEGQRLFYHSDGFSETLDTPPLYFVLPYLFKEEVPDYPDWAEGGFIYQVFVDRFCNGNPEINPKNTKEWHEPSDYYTSYGGDFAGLMKKLDYLDSLGVQIIYLNPVFLSPSYHKYDITDYFEIDPSFGTKEELKELIYESHERGMKVVLDGVFNHSSDQNEMFLDVVKNEQNSKYADWYEIKTFPITKQPLSYDCFAGLASRMPRFDTSNPEVQDYLIGSAEFWTKYLDIDGWRLDVADEVSHQFWKQFRTRIHKVKKNCLILGEIWNQSTRWLLGDECDTATNYKFRDTMLAFARSMDMPAAELWNRLSYNEMKYKTTNLPMLVNLIGSHDTPRIITELNGDKAIARLIIGIMLTYTGMPLLYYGDEVGMEGAKDPDNRLAMQWKKEQQYEPTLVLVKQLGNFRKTSTALRTGNLLENRKAPDRVVAYQRLTDNKEAVVVAANFSDKPEEVSFELSGYKNLQIITGEGELIETTDNQLKMMVKPLDILVVLADLIPKEAR